MTLRGVRFSGAGFSGVPDGLTVTATGSVSMVDGDDCVRQALMMLLSTTPGERLMRPEYGCHLDRIIFAPNDHTTAGLAIHYVRRAIERWEPRVEILGLDANADPLEPARLIMQLTYRVRASLTVSALDFPVDLGAAGSSERSRGLS
jgi:phage baseplate assembly protein W